MIAATYNGADIYLVTERPNWVESVKAKIEILREDTTGLSGRQSRRPYSGTLRVAEFSYTSQLVDAQARELLGSLRTLANQPVMMPLWPAETIWSERDEGSFTGGLMIVFTADWSTWEIYTSADSEPVWPVATDHWAPLMMGHLADTKAALYLHGSLLNAWEVRFSESSPAAYAIAAPAVNWALGPVPPGNSGPLYFFTRAANAADGIRHSVRIQVDQSEIGFGRIHARTFYNQAVVEMNDRGWLLTSMDRIGEFARWFFEHGTGKAFWTDSGIEVGRLTSAIGPSDTVLPVEDVVAVQPGDVLCLLDGDGASELVTVDSIDAGGPTITLTAPCGARAAGSVLTRVMLVAIDRPRMELEWVHGALARGRMIVRSLPEEQAPAEDESVGETIGRVPVRAYLYEFIRDLGGGQTQVTRWTSFESDIEWNGHTWLARRITHGRIRQSLNLERDAVELESYLEADNPLVDDLTLSSEGPLSVVIRRMDM